MNGAGPGVSPYNGSAGHPNVFQGRLTGPNQVTFFGVPVDLPGQGATRTLRFTNLRADVGDVVGGPPPVIFAEFSVNPAAMLPFSDNLVPVALAATLSLVAMPAAEAAPGFSMQAAAFVDDADGTSIDVAAQFRPTESLTLSLGGGQSDTSADATDGRMPPTRRRGVGIRPAAGASPRLRRWLPREPSIPHA
mgnify:CR=1 FL=1